MDKIYTKFVLVSLDTDPENNECKYLTTELLLYYTCLHRKECTQSLLIVLLMWCTCQRCILFSLLLYSSSQSRNCHKYLSLQHSSQSSTYQHRMLLGHLLLYSSSQSRSCHKYLNLQHLSQSSIYQHRMLLGHYLLYSSSQSHIGCSHHQLNKSQMNTYDKYLCHLLNRSRVLFN